MAGVTAVAWEERPGGLQAQPCLDSATAALAPIAAVTTIIATQLALLARLDNFIAFMIAVSGQPPLRDALRKVTARSSCPSR